MCSAMDSQFFRAVRAFYDASVADAASGFILRPLLAFHPLVRRCFGIASFVIKNERKRRDVERPKVFKFGDRSVW